mmetsp:Transcript_103416/g.299172  ORF Transcript_103416/g.299172 Transcript_103416/m.299172 type:complete len:479 (-) Transcript_103416:23-1459(-)
MRQRLLSSEDGFMTPVGSLSQWESEGAFDDCFPPLFFRPGPRLMSAILLASFLLACCLTVWRGWLEERGVSTEDVLKYASIPVVSTVFTYFHIWAALYMTFYPVLYKGCLQIPGTNCGCGWQGIVPNKAEAMARKSVHLMTTKLISVQEVFSRIDPQIVAEELDPVLHNTLTHIIHEVAMQEEPELWHSLPAAVKNELIMKAREDAPTVIAAMMLDVKTNIQDVFDLAEMVVNTLMRDPNLLNTMFIKCGYDELVFIRDCGGYMGAVFGFIQVALWIFYSRGWMLPTFGLVVGLLSNWIALKMIFEPVEPTPILGGRIVLQGLFLKRQKEVSNEYGRVVASKVLSSKNLVPAIIAGRCSDKLFELIHKHVHGACDRYTGVSRPFIRLISGKQKYNRCKHIVGERLIGSLSDTMRHVERQMDQSMDLENLLREKLCGLPSRDFEDLLHPVFQEDEWKLVLMGGVLGVVVGCAQWYVLGS